MSSQFNSEWLLKMALIPFIFQQRAAARRSAAERRSLLWMPSAAQLCVLPLPPPPPQPASTFSLFIYCVEDLNPPKLTCGIDLAQLLLPSLSFFLCPPSVFSSEDFWLIHRPPLWVAEGKNASVTEKDRKRGKERERKKAMGCLYYPDVRLCGPFDKSKAFFFDCRWKSFSWERK